LKRFYLRRFRVQVESPAVRGRGLKRDRPCHDDVVGRVARRARAWIETPEMAACEAALEVARRARAWIETPKAS